MQIVQPVIGDINKIYELLETTIHDIFHREGILETHLDDLINEINGKKEIIKDFFRDNKHEYYYRIARIEDDIVGTIACGQANDVIKKHLKLDYKITPEIKSVYVVPKYQRKGIGRMLFENIIRLLKDMGILEFCLDCGFTKSQNAWRHIIGEPTIVLYDHYGKYAHHMIWHRRVSEF